MTPTPRSKSPRSSAAFMQALMPPDKVAVCKSTTKPKITMNTAAWWHECEGEQLPTFTQPCPKSSDVCFNRHLQLLYV